MACDLINHWCSENVVLNCTSLLPFSASLAKRSKCIGLRNRCPKWTVCARSGWQITRLYVFVKYQISPISSNDREKWQRLWSLFIFVCLCPSLWLSGICNYHTGHYYSAHYTVGMAYSRSTPYSSEDGHRLSMIRLQKSFVNESLAALQTVWPTFDLNRSSFLVNRSDLWSAGNRLWALCTSFTWEMHVVHPIEKCLGRLLHQPLHTLSLANHGSTNHDFHYLSFGWRPLDSPRYRVKWLAEAAAVVWSPQIQHSMSTQWLRLCLCLRRWLKATLQRNGPLMMTSAMLKVARSCLYSFYYMRSVTRGLSLNRWS